MYPPSPFNPIFIVRRMYTYNVFPYTLVGKGKDIKSLLLGLLIFMLKFMSLCKSSRGRLQIEMLEDYSTRSLLGDLGRHFLRLSKRQTRNKVGTRGVKKNGGGLYCTVQYSKLQYRPYQRYGFVWSCPKFLWLRNILLRHLHLCIGIMSIYNIYVCIYLYVNIYIYTE